MDSLKSNVGQPGISCKRSSTRYATRVKLRSRPSRKLGPDLEQWVNEKKAEAKDTIDQWVEDRETQKLAARAQKAEDCAGIAIEIAEASIDDAERMVLEAIAARRDAEAVTVG